MTASVAGPPGLLDLDLGALAAHLGTAPLRFRHRLEHEPLLTQAAIAEAAGTAPPGSVEHHLADLPLLLPSGKAKRLALSAREVADGIGDNGCWMIMWKAHARPDYRRLVEGCLVEVRTVAEREGGVTQPDASLLLSSPHAIVPVHFDTHHNLLLQIEGTKQVMIGRFQDDSVERGQISQRFGKAGLNATRFPDEQTCYVLEPGDGLYVPPYAFHWVVGGPDPSISLACGFRTRLTDRSEMVREFDAVLRRIGLDPRPPGESARIDDLKVFAQRVHRRVRREAPRVRRQAARARREASRLAGAVAARRDRARPPE